MKLIQSIGRKVLNFLEELGEVTNLFLGIVKFIPSVFRHRNLVLYQMEHIGVNSLPLVLVIATFTGAVAAWQAAYQLKGLAPLSFLGTATSRAS